MSLSAAGKRRLQQCESEGLCTACLQPLEGRVLRHMHERCNKAAMRLIASGKTTEKELVRNGEMMAKKSPGRKPSNPLAVKYSEG